MKDKILEILIKEQAWQQNKTDELWKVFKDMDRNNKDYNKISSEYYYNNGMNNEIIILRNKIIEEINNERTKNNCCK